MRIFTILMGSACLLTSAFAGPMVHHIEYVTPRDLVRDVLSRCLESRRSVVIVQDDDKTTVGLATLRDVVASLLGS